MTEYPVHENLDVIDGETISKNDDWWKAVVVCEGYSGPEISVYLWQKREDGTWRRKQKLKLRDEEEWESISACVDGYVTEFFEDGQS